MLSNKSPFELLYNQTPLPYYLTVFCYLYYAIVIHLTHKFDPYAKCCIFVGYPTSQKGYKFYDMETEKFFVSHDGRFHENIFPFSSISTPPNPNLVLPNLPYDIKENWHHNQPFLKNNPSSQTQKPRPPNIDKTMTLQPEQPTITSPQIEPHVPTSNTSNPFSISKTQLPVPLEQFVITPIQI